jgi:hypothetical protein
MRRLAAALALTAVLASGAFAQFSYFSPYQSNAAGDAAGQVFGTPDHSFHSAVRVGGTPTQLPEPAGTSSGFAYAISPNSRWAAGMVTTNGQRQSIRWQLADAAWTVHSTAPTPPGVYFAYPVSVTDAGDATVSGIAYGGSWYYSTWPATGPVMQTAPPRGIANGVHAAPPPPPPAELAAAHAPAAATAQPVLPAIAAPLWSQAEPWAATAPQCVGGQCPPAHAPAARRTGPVRRLLGW